MLAHFYTISAPERQNAISNLAFKDEGVACFVHAGPPAGPAPLYRALSGSGSHFYTMSIAERDNATSHLGYRGEGITGYIYGAPHAGEIPLYRAYRPASDDHFYTTSLPEHQNAVQHLGYTDEGITGYVSGAPAAGAVPLYRLFKTSHFYTTDANERQNAIQHLGYHDEGICCYIFSAPPAGPRPLYRTLASTGSHFYTMSFSERDNATNNLGHKGEGIACYIFAVPQAGQIPLYRAYQPANDDHFYTTNLSEHQNAVQHLGYHDEGITGYVAATSAIGLTAFYRLFGPDAAHQIVFTEQLQQQSNWCWSATTVSVEHFYNPGSGLTQCAFANQALNLNSCCVNGGSNACNQPWYLDRTLSAVGHLASHQGSISLQDLIQQLVANRPVCMRIGWFGGGGHFPVVTGFDVDVAGGPTIEIQDPIFGTSIQDFNTYPATYHGGGSWTDSYLTR